VGSSGKKRTTMAKLNRESQLRHKRIEKQARRAARRSTAAREAIAEASPPEQLGGESDGVGAGSPVAVSERPGSVA
jgi:hypothetical protein